MTTGITERILALVEKLGGLEYLEALADKKEKTLTPWFNPEDLPVHIGVYKTSTFEDKKRTFYSYWNGDFWGFESHNPDRALGFKDSKSGIQSKFWCGLVNPTA